MRAATESSILIFKLRELFGKKIDAAHDLIDVFFLQLEMLSAQRLTLLLIGAGVVAAVPFFRHRRWLADAVRAIFNSQPYIAIMLLGMFAVLIVASQLFEQLTDYIGSNRFRAAEEGLEMNAAIALFLCTLSFRAKNFPFYIVLAILAVIASAAVVGELLCTYFFRTVC